MIVVKADDLTILALGRQGENLARQVVFDLSDWTAEYGDGTAELIVQRPGEDAPYPAVIAQDGAVVTWTLTSADTALASSFGVNGHCELLWYVGETLVKSKTWRTWVESALSTPSETAPPEPEQGWVDQVVAVGAAAKASADAAKAEADRAAALAAEVSKKAAQTAQDASGAAKAMEAAQTAQRLAEEAQGAAEDARTAAAAAQAAAETAATDAAGAKKDAETAKKAAQDAAAAAAKALEDIRALYQEMQTWAQGVIRDVIAAGSTAVQSVQSAGDTQVQRVTDEGTTQTANAKAQADAAAKSASAAQQSATSAAESAAVYDDVVADVNQLKQDLGDLRTKELHTPENIFNAENVTLGYMDLIGGIAASSSLQYTEKINVSEGDVFRVYRYDSAQLSPFAARFITAFNGDTAVASKGAENKSVYTVPSGITSVVLTISKLYTIEVTKNSIPTEYTEYFTPYTVTTVKPNVLPKASETDFGVAKMWVTDDEYGNKVLNISTGDENE